MALNAKAITADYFTQKIGYSIPQEKEGKKNKKWKSQQEQASNWDRELIRCLKNIPTSWNQQN